MVTGVLALQTLDKTVSERKYLTQMEVEHLIAATKGSRNEARDRCMLLLIFRHGLRVSEACSGVDVLSAPSLDSDLTQRDSTKTGAIQAANGGAVKSAMLLRIR
jgi:site-specific recombinase XerC